MPAIHKLVRQAALDSEKRRAFVVTQRTAEHEHERFWGKEGMTGSGTKAKMDHQKKETKDKEEKLTAKTGCRMDTIMGVEYGW